VGTLWRVTMGFANARTVLAGARTAVILMDLDPGYVVARCGRLMRELAGGSMAQVPRGVASALGAALVICSVMVKLHQSVIHMRHTASPAGASRFPAARQDAEDTLHNRIYWDARLSLLLTHLLVLAGLLLSAFRWLMGAGMAGSPDPVVICRPLAV
jgi:hypothetical protein